MADTYPTGQPRIPLILRTQGNGRIHTDQLAPIRGGGSMYKNAAVSFNFMWSAAEKQGVDLNNWGAYMTYQSQLARFYSRYSDKPTDRNPAIRTKWNGKWWFLKNGCAPAANPGESNHGWGMSVDVNPAGARLGWLKDHAPLYGFKWEVGDTSSKYWEPWHLNYCYGSSYTLWVANLIKQTFG